MERIRTRIIIAVAERLSGAKDSNAKTELIEELSENLYQRYLDLAASGVSEEEAYRRAMEDLGDVDELLDYLDDIEGGAATEHNHRGTRDFMSDLFHGVEEVLRETVSQTKDAVEQAKVITHDLSRKMKEKYPDGFSCGYDSDRGGFYWESTRKGTPVVEESIPAENVTAVDVQLHNGDVNIYVAEQDSIEISGDTEELEIRLDENGGLFVRQGKTASSTVMFGRGLVRADVDLTLPAKVWESVKINTVNGDVTFNDTLEAAKLTVQTVSGDVSADNVSSPELTFKSVSGDIRGDEVTGNVKAETVSGDVDLTGSFGSVAASSMSGDVTIGNQFNSVACSSMSGDVDVESETLPESMTLSSKSGDVTARVPGGTGFSVKLHTLSGDLSTDFELVGPMGRKSGSAVYLDGGNSTFTLSSTSGDIVLEQI